MSIRLSCPSCNTSFTLPGLPGNNKALCPRCGDLFPIHSYTTEADGQSQDGESAPSSRTQGEGRKMLAVFAVALVGILLAGLPPFLVYWFGTKKPKQPTAQTTAPVSTSATEL